MSSNLLLPPDTPSASATMTVAQRADGIFSRRVRTPVEITVNDQAGAFVPCYTTLDKIEGSVKITPDHDIAFDDITISLKGLCFLYFIEISNINK